MSTTWTNEDDVLSDGKTTEKVGPGGERAVRDSEQWCLVNANSSTTELAQQLKETKSVEELDVLPGDMDVLPQEINSGETEWTILEDPS